MAAAAAAAERERAAQTEEDEVAAGDGDEEVEVEGEEKLEWNMFARSRFCTVSTNVHCIFFLSHSFLEFLG